MQYRVVCSVGAALVYMDTPITRQYWNDCSSNAWTETAMFVYTREIHMQSSAK